MKDKLKKIITFSGLASVVGFMASLLILENLRPLMIRFQEVSSFQESLINVFGVTLLISLGFLTLFLFRLVSHFRKAKKISLYSLFLLVVGVLAFIFVFGDVALISDIGKQYRHGLSQPEWWILYPVLVCQLAAAVILTHANHSYLRGKGELKYVAKDSNVFLIAQYVGSICGSIGLLSVGLNFLFPRPLWMVKLHVLMTSVLLLIPYLLVVGFWLVIKFQEKGSQWYDEKQTLDIGRSSFFTLMASLVVMGTLFLSNFDRLEGMLSVLWLSFYLFLVLLLFSLGNLYFSQQG